VVYVHPTDEALTVREYVSKDRWATGAWTPQA
jgi:hypothetical protein